MLIEVLNHLNIGINPLSKQPLEIRESIENLVKSFDDCLRKKLEPKFFSAPIDCGFGKTTTLSCYLYHWKASGFLPDNGSLIIVPTLADIEPITENAGLDDADYAIYTPDKDYCDKGLGANRSNRAKVLFITREMLKKRLRKKRMADADEFAYRGRPRALRVCDEAILPAEPINISVDKLLGLVAPLRPFDQPYVERLIAFARAMRSIPFGTIIKVPASLRALPLGLLNAEDTAGAHLSSDQRDLIQTLSMAVGRKLLLLNAKKYGRALVGYGRSLPDDLAPMIIMDASARIRSVYDVWARDRSNLVWMPGATNSYENLTINIWKRACGRSTLAIPKHLNEILEHPTKLIKAKGSEKWVVISFKDNELAGLKVEAELRSRLTESENENVGFITWGRHVGVNDFCHCKNIVVIGAFRQSELTYQARYMAASGRPVETFRGDEWKEIWVSELQDVLLQAICRGNVRNSRNGICGPCSVYMVMTGNPDPARMMAELFPGAAIAFWDPVMPQLRGQSLAVVETLIRLRAEGYVSLSKARLRDHAEITSESRLSQILADERVRRHLDTLGFRVEHNSIYLTGRPLAA